MAHVSQYSQTHKTHKTVAKRCSAAAGCYWIIEATYWHDYTADIKANNAQLEHGKAAE